MKKIKSLVKNERGNVNVILVAIFTVVIGFGLLTIGNYLYWAVATQADSSNLIASRGAYATGNISFNGNVSNGELFNITSGTAVYRFEFNTSVASPSICLTTNCIIVNVYNTNTSVASAVNLTAAINGNASVAAIVTATDSTNVTGLTYVSRGTAGNSVALSDNGALFNVSGATLLGGLEDVTGASAQTNINNYVIITLPLMGLALMILGFSVLIVTLRKSFGEAR